MGKKIKWITENSGICQKEINMIEEYFKIKLPNDYKECEFKFDGGYPIPNRFLVEGKEEIFNNLISLRDNNLIDVYQDIPDKLDNGIIPFAEDPFGNLICFDYRIDKVPKVVFWEHELAYENKACSIKYVCNTFSDLIGMLHEDKDN
jgi:hypothetical protein